MGYLVVSYRTIFLQTLDWGLENLDHMFVPSSFSSYLFAVVLIRILSTVTLRKHSYYFVRVQLLIFMFNIPAFWFSFTFNIILWANVLPVFRMAPPTRQNPGREDVPPPPPPPENPPPLPPPPAEAWQAVMATTNANTQMLLQLLQERGNQQQGYFQHGGNQFA